MRAVTHVRGQTDYCKECGEIGGVYETPINKDGPYCANCIDDVANLEDQENGQFGVGA